MCDGTRTATDRVGETGSREAVPPRRHCSTRHLPRTRLIDDLWAALQEVNGQMLLSGNNHAYERFAALDAEGRPSSDGMRSGRKILTTPIR